MNNPLALLVCLTLASAGCADDSGGPQDRSPITIVVQLLIGPEGGELRLPSGGGVKVPRDALGEKTELEVAEMDPGDLRGFDDVTLLERPIAFRPHGTSFQRGVGIELPRTLGSRNRADSELRLLRLEDEDDRTFEELSDFRVEEDAVRFEALGFSVYAIAQVEMSLQPGDAGGGDADAGAESRDGGMQDGGIQDASMQDGGIQEDASMQDGGIQEDASMQDAAVETSDCDELGDLCCAASTCGAGLSCAGSACSCVVSIGGDHYVRTNGTVRRRSGGSHSGIVRADVFEPLDEVVQVIQGHNHGCGLRNDGTVWCWALSSSSPNGGGELGNGEIGGTLTQYQATRVQVESAGAEPEYLSDVDSLQTGSSMCYSARTNCAVKTDGTVWCWGETTDGDLLNSLPANTNSPYAVQIEASQGTALTGVDAVSVGRRHACVLRSGEVSCWGSNIGGALGSGDGQSVVGQRLYPRPVAVLGSDVDEVGVGTNAACARVGEEVYCWGSTGSGQVGIGDPAENTDGCINYCKLTPQRVQDATGAFDGAARLHMGYLHACALKSDGSLWCWGSSEYDIATPMADPLLPGADAGFVPLSDTALLSACGTGTYSVRILTQGGQLRRSAMSNDLTDPVCE